MNKTEEGHYDIQTHEEKELKGSCGKDSMISPTVYLDTSTHVTLNELKLGIHLQLMEHVKKQ